MGHSKSVGGSHVTFSWSNGLTLCKAASHGQYSCFVLGTHHSSEVDSTGRTLHIEGSVSGISR